jgi:hypothetical protein
MPPPLVVAELPVMVLLVMTRVPVLSQIAAPSPDVAALELKVLLVTVRVPLISMPPPLVPELPLTVLRVRFTVPEGPM